MHFEEPKKKTGKSGKNKRELIARRSTDIFREKEEGGRGRKGCGSQLCILKMIKKK